MTASPLVMEAKIWVNFIKRFHWRPRPTVTTVYEPGMRLSVTRRCGETAIREGKATRSRTPNRSERDAFMRGIGDDEGKPSE